MVIAYWDRHYGTDCVTGQHYDTDTNPVAFADAVAAHPERFPNMSAGDRYDVIERARATHGHDANGTTGGGLFGW